MKLKKALIIAATDIALIQAANVLTTEALAQEISVIQAYSASTGQSDTQEQNGSFEITNGKLVKYTGTEKTVIIPEGVATIGYHAFYQNSTIEEIIFPESMKRVDADGIVDCENLSRIVAKNRHMGLATGNKCVFGTTQIEAVGYYYSSLKEYCDRFDNLTFKVINPDSSHSDFIIKDGVLKDYLGMAEEVIIPEEVTSIDTGVFQNNDNLKRVTIPEGVDHLSWQTFEGCENLEKIVIKCRSITIADKTFNDCINAEVWGHRFSELASYCEDKDNLIFMPLEDKSFQSVVHTDAEPEILISGTEEKKLYKIKVYDMMHTYDMDGIYQSPEEKPKGRIIAINDIGYHNELLAVDGSILHFEAYSELTRRSGVELVSPENIDVTVNGQDVTVMFHYWAKEHTGRFIGTDSTHSGKELFAESTLYYQLKSATRGGNILDGIKAGYNGSGKFWRYSFHSNGELEELTKVTSISLSSSTIGGMADLIQKKNTGTGGVAQTVPYHELYKKVPVIDNHGQEYEDNYGSTNNYIVAYKYAGTEKQDTISLTDNKNKKIADINVRYSSNSKYTTNPYPTVAYSMENKADKWDVSVETGSTEDFLKNPITGSVVENAGGSFVKITAIAPATPIEDSWVSMPKDTEYDGTDKKWIPEIKENGNTLEEGKDYKVTYSTDDFVSAGIINVTIEGIGDYEGTVERSYTITKRSIAVNDTKEVVYNGEDIVLELHGEKAENLVAGHTLELSNAVITAKDVGTYDKVSSYTWQVFDNNGKDVSKNYQLEVSGQLEIIKHLLRVNCEENRGYAGEEITLEIMPENSKNLIEKHTLELNNAVITGKDAGIYNQVSSYTWQVTDEAGEDVTNNYDIEVTGQLIIEKRSISVNAESTQEYGKNGYILYINGDKAKNLVKGHTLELSNAIITGQKVGIYEDVSDYTWHVLDNDGNDVSKNYNLEVSGRLVIVEKEEPEKPSKPEEKPEEPSKPEDNPNNKPNNPNDEPEKPSKPEEPSKPSDEPNNSNDEPEKPSNKPEKPSGKPKNPQESEKPSNLPEDNSSITTPDNSSDISLLEPSGEMQNKDIENIQGITNAPQTGDKGFMTEIISLIASLSVLLVGIFKKKQ